MNDLTVPQKLRHVVTFDDGCSRYTYWRYGAYNLMFLIENGTLIAHDELYRPTEIHNNTELILWLKKFTESKKYV